MRRSRGFDLNILKVGRTSMIYTGAVPCAGCLFLFALHLWF